jgi:hypothetical protein
MIVLLVSPAPSPSIFPWKRAKAAHRFGASREKLRGIGRMAMQAWPKTANGPSG